MQSHKVLARQIVTPAMLALSLCTVWGSSTCGTAKSPPVAQATPPIEMRVTLLAEGGWEGELLLALPSPQHAPPELEASLEMQIRRDVEAIWGRRGIGYTCQQPPGTGGRFCVLTLAGDNAAHIVETAITAGQVTQRLAGPLELHIEASVRRGQRVGIVLPGNPSTGYKWDTASTGLLVSEETETHPLSSKLGAPVRQLIHLVGASTGPANVHLAYRRSWQPDVPPAWIIRVRAGARDLAAVCQALSLPLPDAGPPRQPGTTGVVTHEGTSPSAIEELPQAFSWCDQNGCTPVRDQGACGSCWAFATASPLESALRIQRGLTADLSEQYLLSCNTDGYDCSGGWWVHDYHQWKMPPGESEAGAVIESQAPYLASKTHCNGPYDHPHEIASWAFVGGEYSVPSTAAIKQAIHEYGPVATGICAGSGFDSYSGGIFQTNESCGFQEVNHAVVLMGWDDADQVWVLRNSWGPGWGESGYMRIRYGTSKVGYSANYVVYEASHPFTATAWVHLPLVTRNAASSSQHISGGLESSPRIGRIEPSTYSWDLVLSQPDLDVLPHAGD